MASTPPKSKSIGRSLGDRETRAGRILNEFLDRRARGETASEAELLAAHPDLADELRECLELVGDLRPAAERIDTLITQGVLARSSDPRYLAELGAYKITGCIGRGGMGVVLKAYEESLNRTVALKILRPELADDGNALTRFEREARAAAALNHPNIVTVYAVGQEHGVHYIAMEYIAGPSLADVVRSDDGPGLPTELIRSIFRQLLSALGAAHEAGLIHRDVKSSNILLDRWCGQGTGNGERGKVEDAADPFQTTIVEPVVKLADFGLARMLSSTTRVTLGDSVLGTPEYMSPEQARGDADIDHRTDLYSAGVVLYELLTGRTPFRAEAPTATIHRILHDEPADPHRLNDDVEPNLAGLALRLMAKRPGDRFGSAMEAIELLDADCCVRSLVRRRRLRRRSVAAAALAALIVSGLWLSSAFQIGRDQGVPTEPERADAARISDVKIDEDGHSVLARYSDAAEWRVLRWFPEGRDLRFADATVVDVDGRGQLAVAVGVLSPLDGCSVFLFGGEGGEIWRMDLTPVPNRRWPDCSSPQDRKWRCRLLAAADLDGEPGQEIVAVASHMDEYPERISIIDPRTREIRATFWHLGDILEISVVPSFFGEGRPGIIARGVNNKLDGFGLPFPARPYNSRPGEDEPRADFDQVSVLMVLDPVKMDGLGPPRNPRVAGLRAAQPYAYAFLNQPHSELASFIGDGDRSVRDPTDEEICLIAQIEDAACSTDAVTGPWFGVILQRNYSSSGAKLIVDRNLAIQEVMVMPGETLGSEDDFWRERWNLIVQEYKYVGK